MTEEFKKNKGSMLREHGEEFVEDVLRKNHKHHAQNNPKERHTQKP